MTKTTGLGDRLYIGGVDMSGDVGAIGEIGGGPTGLADVTNNTQNAVSRIATTLAGRLTFDVWHDPAVSHPPLAALPTADVVATYINGQSQACSGLVARQVDYPPKRGTDGVLSFTVQVLSDGSGLEWGRGYVGGPSRTDSAATNGTGVDDGATTSAGMAAYLHVLAFTGTSATVAVEHSNDNGATDPYTTIITFTAVTAAGNGQRVATIATLTIKRWVRVISTGTFTVLTFHVMAFRGASTAVIVAVDIQIFTTSGTWTKPAAATTTHIVAISGGGGGGSGPRRASGTATSGGAGGMGGSLSFGTFRTADMAATETVIVGAGGPGGPARVVDNVNGANGNNGGSSTFGTVQYVTALGGQAGSFGGTAGSIGGILALHAGSLDGVGGGGCTVGGDGLGPVSGIGQSQAAGGGAGGGGMSVTPALHFGNNGGDSLALGFGSGGIDGIPGGNGSSAVANMPVGGAGGAGGDNGWPSGSATAAGNGGNGGNYGGGGGGGGASLNGFNSGAGGNGAPGIVMVVSW